MCRSGLGLLFRTVFENSTTLYCGSFRTIFQKIRDSFIRAWFPKTKRGFFTIRLGLLSFLLAGFCLRRLFGTIFIGIVVPGYDLSVVVIGMPLLRRFPAVGKLKGDG